MSAREEAENPRTAAYVGAPPQLADLTGTPATTAPTRFGRYTIIREIARGGMGIVYEAVDPRLDRTVALKVVAAMALPDGEARGRFAVEVRAAARLKHPAIVPLFDVGTEGDRQFFTMAYVDGPSLAALVRTRALGLGEAVAIMVTVTEAIAYAHSQGVIHRDLKPGNVLVDRGGAAQVTDFGLAKDADADFSLTYSGAAMGTPAYMPPEQARGNFAEVDTRSDVYSLGAILYEMLAGRPVFTADNLPDLLGQIVDEDPVPPRRLNPSLPADIQTICLKCLAKDPQHRYQSAAMLAADLRRFQAGEPIEAAPPSLLYRTRKRLIRHKVVVAVIAAAALAMIVLLAAWAYTLKQETARVAAALAATEDALHELELTSTLVPPEEADPAASAANAAAIAAFLRIYPRARRADDLRARLHDERRRALAGLGKLAETNAIEPLAQTLATVPVLRQLLVRNADSPVAAACRRTLAGNFLLPPPRGRGQTTARIATVLDDLDGGHARETRRQQWYADWTAAQESLYAADFTAMPVGTRPPGWSADEGHERGEVVDPRRGLLVDSNFANSGTLRYRFPAIEHGTLTLRADVSLDAPPDRPVHELGGTVSLGSTGTNWTSRVAFHHGRIVVPRGTSAEPLAAFTLATQRHRVYRIEIRCDLDSRSADALVDGRYLAENVPLDSDAPCTTIMLAANQGTRLFCQALSLRHTPTPPWIDCPAWVPTVHAGDLAATPVATFPHMAMTDPVCTMPSTGRMAVFAVEGLDPPALVMQRLGQPPLDVPLPPGRRYVPIGATNGRLLCWDTEDGEFWKHPATLFLCDPPTAVAPTLEPRPVITHREPSQTVAAACRLPGGRPGLVLGYGSYLRGIEIFEWLPGDPPALVPRGFHQSSGPEASDVLALATADWDGDGDDEIFIGFGPWNQYRAMVVTLDDALVPTWTPLTKPHGCTLVATGELPDVGTCLVAVSAPTQAKEGELLPGAGLRLWRLANGRADLVYEQPGAFYGLAVGEFGGAPAVVLAEATFHGTSPRRSDITVSVNSFRDGALHRRWETAIHDTPFSGMGSVVAPIPILVLADFTGDAANELLISAFKQGVVFAARPGQPPAADDSRR